MPITSIIQHNIGCIVCGHNFSYIGSIDTENIIESNSSIIADSVIATGDQFYSEEDDVTRRNIEIEVVVTCPKCKSKLKQLNASKVFE